MESSKFQISIVARVSLLLLNSFVLVYFAYDKSEYYFILFFSIILLIQSYYLIKHINSIHHYLTLFLRVIKESRDSYTLPANKNDFIFSELSSYFREIREVIKDAKIEKENQYHYLQYVVEHVGIGLMAFDEKGKVELLNNAGKKLLGIPALLNIKTLDSIHKDLTKTVAELKLGQTITQILNINNELIHLSLRASQFKMMEKSIKLVSFQNIKAELDEKELDSWQKLIRILNHEIMNSITPITTLATSIKKTYTRGKDYKTKDEIDEELIQDTVHGLNIIEERGKGLVSFVNKYRSLSTNVNANIATVKIEKLFSNVLGLLKNDFDNNSIDVDYQIEYSGLEILADEKLLEQVLINLLKNSIQALERKRLKLINISAHKTSGRVEIRVKDNGKGIPETELENIFIPFYTTKEKGSGIGLSLSRQIMRLHKGSIKVNSVVNEGTEFTLTF